MKMLEKKQQIQSSMGIQNDRYDGAHKFPGWTVFKYRLRSGDEKDWLRRRISMRYVILEIRHGYAAWSHALELRQVEGACTASAKQNQCIRLRIGSLL